MKKIILEGISIDEFEQIIERRVRVALEAMAGEMQRNTPHKLLSYQEVFERFGIKRKRLYELHNSGVLHYLKDGRCTRWRESDIISYTNQLKSA